MYPCCAWLQVVEATTANGLCTLRIRAAALPGAVAIALDENMDILRQTLLGAEAADDSGGAGDDSPNGQADATAPSSNGPGEQRAPAATSNGGAADSGAAPVSQAAAEGQAATEGQAAEPAAQPAEACSSSQDTERALRSLALDAASTSGLDADQAFRKAGKLGALHERLEAAAVEAGGQALHHLQRVWALGPKRVGPALLLCRQQAQPAQPSSRAGSNRENGTAAGRPQSPSVPPLGAGPDPGGLFSVADKLVVRLAKQLDRGAVPAAVGAGEHPGQGSGELERGSEAGVAADTVQVSLCLLKDCLRT